MGNDLRYVCLVETRRLLLFMGAVFGLILFVQYYKLPYVGVLSSVFETSKSRVETIENDSGGDSWRRTSSDLNTTDGAPTATNGNFRDGFVVESERTPVVVDFGDDSGVENGKTSNETSGDDFVLESGHTLNETFGDDFSLEYGKALNDTLDDGFDPEEEIPLKDSLEMDRDLTIDTAVRNDVEDTDDGLQELEETSGTKASFKDDERNGEKNSTVETPFVAQSPSSLLSDSTETSPPNSTIVKESENILQNDGNPNIPKKERFLEPELSVVPVSKMNNMLLESHLSHRTPKMRWSSPADNELRNVRFQIENAPLIHDDPELDVSLYRNFSTFKRSYELMEQTLKVYIYGEGERPVFHQPPLKGIYASEGWFMKLLKSNKRFLTKKPKKAHLFYLPFSSRMLEVALYVPDSHNREPLIETLTNYVDTIKTKYNYWNRSAGSDHFLVACHDWAPAETRKIMANCIRSLCNADINEGFEFGKDASLPETYIQTPQNPLRQLGGKPVSQRRNLAFFAGNMHGYLRPILLQQWQNKDPGMKIFGQIPNKRNKKRRGETSYVEYMKSSKYCICARGFEVNSPRVVEAIFYECVPVIISDNFVPPFFEVLNWETFAVFVLERDIPNLKTILESIPMKRYVEMQRRVRKVQQHFLWHQRAVKYDVFHMILHSIWYNRVFQSRF